MRTMNPFSCCLSSSSSTNKNSHQDTYNNSNTVDVVSREEGEGATAAAVSTNTNDDEVALAKSIYHDARQSLTASMLYPPASSSSSVIRTTSALGRFDLESDPQQLLFTPSSVQVKQGLQQQQQRGYPGDLTLSELEACLEFRREVRKKHKQRPEYFEMVYCYRTVEEEAYALCRFLRSRNFVVSDVLTMMERNVETWNDGKVHNNFYTTHLKESLGCPSLPILWTQLPIIHSGLAKNGSLVAYFQVGSMCLEALECCLADLDKLVAFVWYEFMYTFPECIRQQQQSQAARAGHGHDDCSTTNTFIRCEITLVIDLKGISRSLFTEQVLAVLRDCCNVLNCFPEVLNKMMIVNAPYFFSIFWVIIKQFLDARTVDKIDIFAKEANGLACMSEHIAKKELLADYGGNGPSFADVVHGLRTAGTCRQLVERLFLPPSRGGSSEATFDFALSSGERAIVVVYTRSTSGANFVISSKSGNNGVVLKEVCIKRKGPEHNGPYSRTIELDTNGNARDLTVSAKSLSTSSSPKDCFLVVILVYNNV